MSLRLFKENRSGRNRVTVQTACERIQPGTKTQRHRGTKKTPQLTDSTGAFFVPLCFVSLCFSLSDYPARRWTMSSSLTNFGSFPCRFQYRT